MRKLPLLLLLTSALSAQTSAKKPPTIPDATIAKYWKAQSQLNVAKEAFDKAQQEIGAAIAEIQKACGADSVPQMSPAGDPICAPKSESKSEAKK